MQESTILIVPGLREHVPEHWQTLLAEKLPRMRCVAPLQHDKLSCSARVDAIEQTMDSITGPIIVVAHSAGVIMMLHWAQRYARPARQIKGALLATPPDLEAVMPEGYPTMAQLRENGWLPIPRDPLPFPNIVAVSRNDPLARFGRIINMAREWESDVLDLGEVGHLNPASGYGEWPLALDLIKRLDGCHDSGQECLAKIA